jgi:hypothetical protein
MSHLCLLGYSGVQHILGCVSCLRLVLSVANVSSFSRLSILDFPFVLPVSLDCPFLISPSCCQVL